MVAEGNEEEGRRSSEVSGGVGGEPEVDGGFEVTLPWQARTPQQHGRKRERDILKDLGAMAHPMSGAGGIKHDGHDDEHLYEVKTAKRHYSLQAHELEELWRKATRQGLDPVMVVEFKGITAYIFPSPK